MEIQMEKAKWEKLQILLDNHRQDAVITCPEDCWCWELDQLLAEAYPVCPDCGDYLHLYTDGIYYCADCEGGRD